MKSVGFRVLIAALAVVSASQLTAQERGMSDDYVDGRTEAKYAKPHGISFGADLLGFGAFFNNSVRVRSLGVPGDRIDYNDDAGGYPIGIFGEANVFVRWSWWDSVHAGYSISILRGFEDDLEEAHRFNGVGFPEGVDMDFASDWHDVHAYYRRDLLRLGATKSMTLYALAGLEWGYVSLDVDSDDFPAGDRSEEDFREMLPWYTVGAGFEWEITRDFVVHAQGRGTYFAGLPTFQERDDKKLKQSVTSINARASFEWRINDWVSVLVRAKYRYIKIRLYGGSRQNNFVWHGYGPEVGVGFRF